MNHSPLKRIKTEPQVLLPEKRLLDVPKDVISKHIGEYLTPQAIKALNATCTLLHSVFRAKVKTFPVEAERIRNKYLPNFERFSRASFYTGIDFYIDFEDEHDEKETDEEEFIDFALASLYHNLFHDVCHYEDSEFLECMELLFRNYEQWEGCEKVYESLCKQLPQLIEDRNFVASIYPNSKETEPLQTCFVAYFPDASCFSLENAPVDDEGELDDETLVVDLMEEMENPQWISDLFT